MPNPTIMMTTLGTYPFHGGGVSVWCDTLIKQSTQYDFTVLAITGNEQVTEPTPRPPNLNHLIHLPIWEPYSALDIPQPVDHAFLIPYGNILEFSITNTMVYSSDELGKLADWIIQLWEYFRNNDWLDAWYSPQTWHQMMDTLSILPQPPTIADAKLCLHILRHHLSCLQLDVPQVDLIHHTVAGMNSLVGIIAKEISGTPILLTEHGVLLRESYYRLNFSQEFSPFVKKFLAQLDSVMAQLTYWSADHIYTVANYNKEWLRPFKIAYNKTIPSPFKVS
jgi:polysaccharide biosynthesis protein PelF